jgi:hypothetical protein
MARLLFAWLKALRWQRLPEMEKLGDTLVNHFGGIAALLRSSGPLWSRRVIEYDDQGRPRRARGKRDETMLLKLKWATPRPIRSARDLARFLKVIIGFLWRPVIPNSFHQSPP